MTFWLWSRTAANNATADSTVNFREGQSPASVNDSARASMAALAKYRDDISGAITTGGSSTAYTVTSYQVLTSLTDGFTVAFRPHATSGATPTLNVDGLGAKPLRGVTGTALGAGYLIAGTPYRATYFASADEWVVHGFFAEPYAVPVGGFMPFVSETPPNSNFVLPYGQAISRTTYDTLFALCGTAFGSGDGSTTFNVPDLRGRAIFGLDDMGGSAAGRVTTASSSIDGGTIGAAGGAQNLTLPRSALPNVTLGLTTNTTGAHTHNTGEAALSGSGSGTAMRATANSVTSTSSGDHSHTGTTDSINGNVTQTAFNKMPPALILPYIMRVI